MAAKSKKDPICGMKGTIPKYDHYFCSENCITKYEKKEGIKTTGKNLRYALLALGLVALVVYLRAIDAMVLFMGIFFIVVSLLKMIDWKGFANAFAMYDVIGKRSKIYAYVYPAIEFGLGLAFYFSYQVTTAAWVLLVIMIVGAIGVGQNLLSKNPIRCACLGTKIKVPLTKFTFFEDITMAGMAVMILFF